MDKQQLKEKLSSTHKWMRLLYMILFLIILGIAKFIIILISLVQFILVLFTDNVNAKLLEFGAHLSAYIAQVLLFLTFNTEDKPYPFAKWPGSPE